MARRSRQRGITWIETGIVLAVVGIVTAQAVPSMSRVIDARRLEGAAVQLVTDIQYARTEAVARNQPVRLSLHSTTLGSCYVLHTGLSAQCPCTDAAPAVCSGDAREIRTVFLPTEQGVAVAGNAASVLFDPLHGTSTPSATFRVLGRHDRALHQIVNVMGRVRTCTPAAGFAGYPTC
jgi:type IV fimbrial biogenesis protein FimT